MWRAVYGPDTGGAPKTTLIMVDAVRRFATVAVLSGVNGMGPTGQEGKDEG